MRATVVLTVAESKRLIARGVAALPSIKRAIGAGTIAVAKGTTNGYVVEDLLGKVIEKRRYVTGRTLPTKNMPARKIDASLPDVVLRNGRPVDGISVTDAIADMGAGDVFLKGANALNYERRQTALLIGHHQGGTIGAAIGHTYGRRIDLLVPVGLEKNVAGDLNEASRWTLDCGEGDGPSPRLWVFQGRIFTEIEALSVLAGVGTCQLAAGGVGGAEGAVRLGIQGDAAQVKTALELVESIAGEPPFVA
jgi:hypothetical protein